jgi:hypothetical protein
MRNAGVLTSACDASTGRLACESSEEASRESQRGDGAIPSTTKSMQRAVAMPGEDEIASASAVVASPHSIVAMVRAASGSL